MGISLNPSTLLNGQGIDVSELVQEVLNESSGQLTEWQNEQATLQSQASDLTTINSDLSNLATAVQALSDPLGALTQLTATSSDDNVVTATASSGATAGTNDVVVNNLATAGLVYSNDFSGGANATILPSGANSGEIDLQIGGSSGTTKQIMINSSNDTLTSLAQYINQQNWGVTANVVTDVNGSRLALTSQSTGTAGALAIASNNTGLTFATPTGGVNASLTIDGIPYASASNTITGAIPGVTLNLANASPDETVQVTVGANTSGTEEAIENFVSAYNQVVSDINQEFTVNTSTNAEGPLGSDSALRSLQSSLLSDVTYSMPSTASSTTGTLNTVDMASANTSILPSGQTTGDIELQIGGSSGTTVDLPITAGSNDTLNTLASYINTQSTQNSWGVTASVVQDSGGYHLSISSQATGASAALAITNNTTLINSNGGIVNLASLGINMNNDGTLSVGSSPTGETLDQLLSSNPSAVLNFFQNASSSTGFATNFNSDLTNLTNPTTGVLNADLAQNQSEQQDITNSINNFQVRLTAEQQALTTEFNQVNVSLQSYPLLLQETTETLASLDASSSGSSSSSIPTLSSGL
ncbi:MAG TPA: flagellar filament capping protein FliD [Verrucomicrobiae bacterium]|nr:flagellar filament capping protein FliD [Verrucomicrobiae bacterium]